MSLSVSQGFGSAAILAGGRSLRRRGLDKQTMEVDGEALIFGQIRMLSQYFSEIVIVTARPELYQDISASPGTELRITQDILPGCGPLSGLHAALSAAGSNWIFLTACDMPGFDPDLAKAMQMRIMNEAAGTQGPVCACVAACGSHFEPFHAFYSTSLIEPATVLIQSCIDMAAGRAEKTPERRASIGGLLARRPHLRIPEDETRRYSPDWSLFCNINTQEDLAGYLHGLRRSDGERGRLR